MKNIRLSLIASVAFGLNGCANRYVERNDTFAFSAGDAVASNLAVQIRDPWPKGSQDTKIPMDPVKAGIAMYNYRCGSEDNPQQNSSGFSNDSSGFANNSSNLGGSNGSSGASSSKGGYC